VKILVTGGAGFIGANIVSRLVDFHEVVVLDDLSTGISANLSQFPGVLTHGSILDQPLLDRVAANSDVIIHLAARPSVPRSLADPVSTHHVNATGTLNVLETARKLDDPLVIVASSSSVYGNLGVGAKREDLLPQPASPYAASKLLTEQYALAWARSFGLRTIAFRFFNVYGPFQRMDHSYAAVIPKFLSAALLDQPIYVHGSGNQTRDFTNVHSLCDVIQRTIEGNIDLSESINLAFGTQTSLLDLIGKIETLLDKKLIVEHLPPRMGDIEHSRADCSRLHQLFPNLVPIDLETGLRTTSEWLRMSIESHTLSRFTRPTDEGTR